MILAILQARVSSSRLPGKVLMPILGEPMLARQLERIQRSREIDKLMIATSDRTDDYPLIDLCHRLSVEVFAGSLNDVLDRFYQAARRFNPDHVVRLTGDCPLIDPALVDRVIVHHIKGAYDYTSNAHEPSFPDGLDVEIVPFPVLENVWRIAGEVWEREHVTTHLWKHPEKYRLGLVRSDEDLSHLRWTVDEQVDLDFVTAVFERLYPSNPHFDMRDVLELLQREPALRTVNEKFGRNEGLTRQLPPELRKVSYE